MPENALNTDAFERVQRKKRLLQQRDEILESIGRDVYSGGAVPAEFDDLSTDRKAIDALVQQLEERVSPIAHELERLVAKQPELEQELRNLDLIKKNTLEPKKAEHDELATRTDDMAAANRRAQLEDEVKKIREEFGVKRKVLKNEMDGIERRAEGMRSEIQKIKDEEDQLIQKWDKRLRDLGYLYYSQQINESLYTTRFGQLDLLQQELTALRQVPEKSHDAGTDKKAAKWSKGALYFLGLAAVVVVVLLQFRTSFRHVPLPVDQLYDLAKKEGLPTIAFQQDAKPEEVLLNHWLADFSRAPGSAAFGQLDPSKVQSWFVARAQDGSVRYLALKFQHTLPVFKRLVESGWSAVPNNQGVQSLSNGAWTWISFGSNAFGLVPRAALESINLSNIKASGMKWRIEIWNTPFSAAHPLINDFDRIRVEWQKDGTASFALASSTEISDLDQRVDFLTQSHLKDLNVRITQDGLQFNVAGFDLNKLSGANATITEVEKLSSQYEQRQIRREVDSPLQGSVINQPAIDLVAATPKGTRQVIVAIQTSGDELSLLGSAQVGEHLTDIAVLKGDDLVLVDRSARTLIRSTFVGGGFHVKAIDRMTEVDADMQPIRAIVAPDQKELLVLFEPTEKTRGAIGLFDPVSLKVKHMLELPGDGQVPLCAVWDGDLVFVGIRASQNSGSMTRSVLAYRSQSDKLMLSHLLDLPTPSLASVRVPALAISRARNEIVAFNTVETGLARFSLAGNVTRPTDQTPLTQLNMINPSRRPLRHDDPGSLIISRNQHLAIVSDLTDFSTRDFGTKLFLIDLDAERPLVVGEHDLGGMIFSTARQPLSDTMYVTMSNDRSIARIKIGSDNLVFMDKYIFERMSPQRLAFSQFGEIVFVTGLLRDSE